MTQGSLRQKEGLMKVCQFRDLSNERWQLLRLVGRLVQQTPAPQGQILESFPYVYRRGRGPPARLNDGQCHHWIVFDVFGCVLQRLMQASVTAMRPSLSGSSRRQSSKRWQSSCRDGQRIYYKQTSNLKAVLVQKHP